MNDKASTPLAKKLPDRLKQKLVEREYNFQARSPARHRTERVQARRSRLLDLRKLRTATHNQRVQGSRVKQELQGELQSYRTALAAEERQQRAESLRTKQLEATVARVAAQNEATRQHAVNVDQLHAARQQNKLLRHVHSQVVADKRRRELNYLRSQTAALHNERVALTKDYVKISDYFEEVDDDADDDDDEQKDDSRRRGGRRGAADDDDGDDDDDDDDDDSNPARRPGQVRYYHPAGAGDEEEDSQDQWSNVVNVGDEESFADLSYMSSTGPGSVGGASSVGRSGSVGGGGANNRSAWQIGQSLILSVYTPLFRETLTAKYQYIDNDEQS
jgi:hypothetical protein